MASSSCALLMAFKGSEGTFFNFGKGSFDFPNYFSFSVFCDPSSQGLLSNYANVVVIGVQHFRPRNLALFARIFFVRGNSHTVKMITMRYVNKLP